MKITDNFFDRDGIVYLDERDGIATIGDDIGAAPAKPGCISPTGSRI